MAYCSLVPFVPRLIAHVGPGPAMLIGCASWGAGFSRHVRVAKSLGLDRHTFRHERRLRHSWLASETWVNSFSKARTRGRIVAAYSAAFFLRLFCWSACIEDDRAIRTLALSCCGVGHRNCFSSDHFCSKVRSAPWSTTRQTASSRRSKRHPLHWPAVSSPELREFAHFSLTGALALEAGLHQDQALSLVTITAGGVVLLLPMGWLADKVPRVPLLLAMIGALIVLTIVLPFVLRLSVISAIVVFFLLGGVAMGLYSLSLTLLGEQVPRSDLTTASVAFLALYEIGAIIGPVVAGFAMMASAPVGFACTIVGLDGPLRCGCAVPGTRCAATWARTRLSGADGHRSGYVRCAKIVTHRVEKFRQSMQVAGWCAFPLRAARRSYIFELDLG